MDYGENFSPIARMEGVRTLIAYAAYKGFKVYRMDVKSIFLNKILEAEVYIEQLEGFVADNIKDMVCVRIFLKARFTQDQRRKITSTQ